MASRLLALIQMRHLRSVVGNVQVAIFVAVVNAPIAAMHLGAFGNENAQYCLCANFNCVNRQIRGRSEFLRVVDRRDEILAHLRHNLWCDTLNLARILYPQQNCPAMPIEKGTDGLIDVPTEAVVGCLEFHRDSLSLADQFPNLVFVSIHLAIPLPAHSERLPFVPVPFSKNIHPNRISPVYF